MSSGFSLGRVKWFDEKRGFGFLNSDDGQYLYFHYKDIATPGHRTIGEHQRIRYSTKMTQQGLRATEIVSVPDTVEPWRMVKNNFISEFARWLCKRKSVRCMWVYSHDELKVNMIRYYLFRCRFFEAYLHQFFLNDEEVLHNHPWSFTTFLIAGSYVEERDNGAQKKIAAPNVRYVSARDYHRVLIDPERSGNTWSFVLTGPRNKKWGFVSKSTKKTMTPSEYGYHRGVELRTYADFKVQGVFFPTVLNGMKAPAVERISN